MPLDHTRFTRRPPTDEPRVESVHVKSVVGPINVRGDIGATDPDGESALLSVGRTKESGQIVSDLTAQSLMVEVLCELKHIRLHLEALSGEDLRGDVDYADQ